MPLHIVGYGLRRKWSEVVYKEFGPMEEVELVEFLRKLMKEKIMKSFIGQVCWSLAVRVERCLGHLQCAR